MGRAGGMECVANKSIVRDDNWTAFSDIRQHHHHQGRGEYQTETIQSGETIRQGRRCHVDDIDMELLSYSHLSVKFRTIQYIRLVPRNPLYSLHIVPVVVHLRLEYKLN